MTDVSRINLTVGADGTVVARNERGASVVMASDLEEAFTPVELLAVTMVARHLFLFVVGKMQVAALGDFCCASRPIRQETESRDIA